MLALSCNFSYRDKLKSKGEGREMRAKRKDEWKDVRKMLNLTFLVKIMTTFHTYF